MEEKKWCKHKSKSLDLSFKKEEKTNEKSKHVAKNNSESQWFSFHRV